MDIYPTYSANDANGRRYTVSFGHADEPIDAFKPADGVEALKAFYRRQGSAFSLGDQSVLARMCGDFVHPPVAGASRFFHEAVKLTEIMGLRWTDGRDRDELTERMNIARLVYVNGVYSVQRSIENKIILPLLEIFQSQMSLSKREILDVLDCIWCRESIAIVDQAKQNFSEQISQIERRHGHSLNVSNLNKLKQFAGFMNSLVEVMTKDLNAIENLLFEARRLDDISVLSQDIAPRLLIGIERWYEGYKQLTRIVRRMELGHWMKILERELIAPLRPLQGSDFIRQVKMGGYRRKFLRAEGVLKRIILNWEESLRGLRETGNFNETLRGLFSDISHYSRGIISKPIMNLAFLSNKLKDVESKSDEDDIVRFKAEADRWARIEDGFLNRMGEGPVLDEIETLFGGYGIVVRKAMLPDSLNDNGDLLMTLVHLLLNTVKYTPELGREVVVKAEGPRGGYANRIIVRDNGPGIPLDRQMELKINEPSEKVTPVKSERGLGMGLHDVRTRLLPNLNGVSMNIKTAPNLGTAVTLSFDAISRPLNDQLKVTGRMFTPPSRSGPVPR